MIFSRFFSPSHTSTNPEHRLKAIAALTPENPNERSILHELAFNDASHEVTLAALAKLNSFPLWLKMSQISKNQRIRKAAVAKVEAELLDHASTLSSAEIQEYLLVAAPIEQVVKCFPRMIQLHDNVPFCLQVMQRVNRPAFSLQFVLGSDNTALQAAFIDATNDVELLKKAMSKSRDDGLKTVIASKLDNLLAAQEKPQKLHKALRLTLAKMLALCEKSDYQLVQQQQAELNEEYRALMTEADCLDAEVRAELDSKYQKLTSRIAKLLNILQADWQAAQRRLAHQQTKAQADAAVQQVTALHEQLQGEQILGISLGEVSRFQEGVEAAEVALEALAEFEPPADHIEPMLASFRRIWDQLPELQRKVKALDELLQSWQQDLNNEDKDCDLGQLQQQWQAQIEQLIVVPSYLKQRWQQFCKQHKKRQRAWQQAQQQQLKGCRKHFSIINNLIEQGKYRAAMARFKRLVKDYERLPSDAQREVKSRFDQIEDQISHLEGWQSYIAAPRRPALLADAKALLADGPRDMRKRAQEIKYLRQQWLSLGEAKEPQDQVLHREFDQVLEQAFEPCRAYFAARDNEQSQAATYRQQLIEQLRTLISAELPLSEKNADFEGLKRDWQKAAKTDSQRYVKLRGSWDECCAQMEQQLAPWWDDNRQQKAALIEQIKGLVEHADVPTTGQQAKAIQSAWKQIGFAGKRYESKLWLAFKAANDILFTAIKGNYAQRQSEQESQVSVLNEALQEARELIASGDTSLASEQVASIQGRITQLGEGAQRALKKACANVVEQLAHSRQAERRQQQQQAILSLVEALFNTAPGVPTVADALPQAWAKGAPLDSQEAFNKALITLEILAQEPAEPSDASLRSTIQLHLMQVKLNGESLPDPNALIGDILASPSTLLVAPNAAQRMQRLLMVYCGLEGE